MRLKPSATHGLGGWQGKGARIRCKLSALCGHGKAALDPTAELEQTAASFGLFPACPAGALCTLPETGIVARTRRLLCNVERLPRVFPVHCRCLPCRVKVSVDVWLTAQAVASSMHARTLVRSAAGAVGSVLAPAVKVSWPLALPAGLEVERLRRENNKGLRKHRRSLRRHGRSAGQHGAQQ